MGVFKKVLGTVAAMSLTVVPAVAQAATSASKLSLAPAARASKATDGKEKFAGGAVIGLLAAAAVIAGIVVVVSNNDDDPDSN